MKAVIIGNGILGLTTARALLKKEPQAQITIVGPADQKGCASLAAAAMFNSFCEIDAGTLHNKREREKFLFNKSATPYWPSLLEQLQAEADHVIERGFGTFLINNHATDDLEDRNFDAVISALKEFSEPYETVNAKDIPHYKPGSEGRASRAILIPSEGWVNPISLIEALKKILRQSKNVTFVDQYCQSLTVQNNRIVNVLLSSGEKLSGDIYLMTPGAAFSKILDQSQLHLKMPRIFYGVGASILLKTGDATLKNCVRTPNRGLACGVYSAPQNATHTLIGASNFISPEPEDYSRVTSAYTLLKSAMEQINTDYYRAQVVKINVGWRPTSADTMPLIGKTSIQNMLVATGTKRDGLHCSPVISDHLSDLILNKKPSTEYPSFEPERDLIRVYTRQEAIDISVHHTINAAYQHDFKPSKNRILEDLRNHYRSEFEKLHDQVGAIDWGIPPEMNNMYKYGHVK